MSRAFAVIPDGQWPIPIVAAVKAMSKGKATEGQQIAVLNFIIEDLAGTYDLSFRPEEKGGSHETAFADGRRFVGIQLRRVISKPFETLTGKPTTGEKPS